MKESLDYLQPDFFHFSQDSIQLAKIVTQELGSSLNDGQAMDVGAGCGVVGLEILKNVSFKINFDFLELQKDFLPFFNQNKNLIGEKARNCNFFLGDFRHFPIEKKYSLIVSNPPYFPVPHNKLGKDLRKNSCRFFTNGSYFELVRFFQKGLKENGSGFFLLRTNERWGRDTLDELQRKFGHYFLFRRLRLDDKTSLIIINVLNIN